MNKCLIYLVAADPVKGNFLRYHFKSAGFKNVLFFHDQDECISSIRRKNIPDFVIAETSLNSSADIEFLKLIKAGEPRVRVVFLTDLDDVSHMEALLEAGAADYVQRNGSNRNWTQELISNLQYLIRDEFSVR